MPMRQHKEVRKQQTAASNSNYTQAWVPGFCYVVSCGSRFPALPSLSLGVSSQTWAAVRKCVAALFRARARKMTLRGSCRKIARALPQPDNWMQSFRRTLNGLASDVERGDQDAHRVLIKHSVPIRLFEVSEHCPLQAQAGENPSAATPISRALACAR